jgi:hypothetical protein
MADSRLSSVLDSRPRKADRPRRRDIALTVTLGFAVMLVLAAAGELSAGALAGGAGALIAWALCTI